MVPAKENAFSHPYILSNIDFNSIFVPYLGTPLLSNARVFY